MNRFESARQIGLEDTECVGTDCVQSEAQSSSQIAVSSFDDAEIDSTDPAERYRLDSEIGRGGMGTVYRAYDRVLDRKIAIKVLHATYATDSVVIHRIKREARLSSKISHPNVVRTFDFGKLRGAPFISMALIEGENLGQLIRRSSPIPWQLAVHYSLGICRALETAHSVGVVHRDLKPQNVLIDEKHNVHVSDFGLAKSLQEDTSVITKGDESLGTPRYMSPEQRAGIPVDYRTDIYSFGAVLYEVLTGKPPFSDLELIDNAGHIWERQPISIRALGIEIPEQLERIVFKCLEPRPELRYTSARHLLQDLFPLSIAKQPTTWYTLISLCKKAGKLIRYVVLLLFLIGTIGFVYRLAPVDWKAIRYSAYARQASDQLNGFIRELAAPGQSSPLTAPNGLHVIHRGPIDLRAHGVTRRIASNALAAWVIDHGRAALYVMGDNETQSLLLYNPQHDTSKTLLVTKQLIDGVVELVSGRLTTLAVRVRDPHKQTPSLVVVNLDGSPIEFRGADILGWDGDTLAIGHFTAVEWLSIPSKPHKIDRYSIRQLLTAKRGQ